MSLQPAQKEIAPRHEKATDEFRPRPLKTLRRRWELGQSVSCTTASTSSINEMTATYNVAHNPYKLKILVTE